MISLPPEEVTQIARLSLYALDLVTAEDHDLWIRASNTKTATRQNRLWVDVEISPHGKSSPMEVHIHPLDPTQSLSRMKQSLCDELMKSFYMAFLKIIEPDIEISDPDVTQAAQAASRERRVEVREVVRERVLVICPFCGHKNEQGMQFCEKCKANI